MSIKRAYLNKLKQVFLFDSRGYKEIRTKSRELSELLVKKVEEYSIKDISKEELEVLKELPTFWVTLVLYPGPRLKSELGYSCSYGYNYLRNRVYANVTETFSHNFRYSEISEDVREEINSINEEIIKCQEKLDSLSESWDRLINRETKKTWLKKNFKDIYEELKRYERIGVPV